MNRLISMVVIGLAAACGSSASNTPSATSAPAQSAQTTTPPAVEPAFVHASTFGGLVRGVAALGLDVPYKERDCLLGADANEVTLGVAPAPALKTMPEAPMHLAEALAASTGHARVLTRWGQRGGEPFDLLVATFTPLPPSALANPVVVAVITRTGIVLRETEQVLAVAPLTHDDAALWLLERTSRGPFTLLVTAEAETPAIEVHALLRALPSSVRDVALAVALDPATSLPSTAPQAPDARMHCPDGLPEPPASAPEGDLPSASIVRSMTAIHERLQRCLANTTGPGTVGGKVTLALRIADTGNVSASCLVEDAIHDNILAACLTETARTATFSRPTPVGFVDVHIPLSLAPSSDPSPRVVCE